MFVILFYFFVDDYVIVGEWERVIEASALF